MGWTLRGAARESGINAQNMRHLEGRTPTGAPPPERIQIGTAFKLIEAYYPNLTLEHFLPECAFEVVRR